MTRIFDFEEQLLSYLENFRQQIQSRPLNLGGISGSGGGSGGPPGGFVGQLPQIRVSFDSTEDETLSIPSSGQSLLDNLNRIRYRIKQIETTLSGGFALSVQESNTPVASNVLTIDFINGIVNDVGNNEVEIYIPRSGTPASSFYDLDDVPHFYTGNAGKILVVNSSEDGLEYINRSFINLIDTPSTYSGSANKILKVNSAENSVEFTPLKLIDLFDTPNSYSAGLFLRSTVSGFILDSASTAFTNLSDTFSDYTGRGGEFLVVRLDETGIETVSGLIISTFYSLTDTPNSYAGHAGKIVVVNDFESGLTFVTPSGLQQLGINIKNNNIPFLDNVVTLNFEGAEIIYDSPEQVTIKVSGAGSGIAVESEGNLVASGITTLNLVGFGVSQTGFTEVTVTDILASGLNTFVALADTPSSYVTQSGKFVRVNSSETGLEFSTAPTPALSFSDLTDTPSYLIENAYIKTNNSIPPTFQFVSGPLFKELQDAPDDTYVGYGGKFIRVREDEYMLEYVDLSLSGYTNFIDLEDTPTTYSGQAGKAVVVNSTEDGLDFVNVSGIGNYNFWISSAPPVSANSYSDEFDDEYFDSSIWNIFDPNSNLNVYEQEHGLELVVDNTSSHEIIGVYRDIPSLTDFSVWTKSLLFTYYDKGSKCGMFISPDTTITTSSDLVIIGTAGNGVYRWIQVEHYNDYTSYNSTYINHETPGFTFPSFMRLRFHLEYPDLFLWVDDSLDGIWWYNISHKFQGGPEDYFELPFTPQSIGFFIRKEFGDAMELKAVFPFFRVYSGNSITTVPKGRRI